MPDTDVAGRAAMPEQIKVPVAIEVTAAFLAARQNGWRCPIGDRREWAHSGAVLSLNREIVLKIVRKSEKGPVRARPHRNTEKVRAGTRPHEDVVVADVRLRI